ncbi:hypothetical protein GDO81_003024 [Engystomops pustulosus]|uniref:Uncharacterized protein n=1 Tax=Engystomops pustulosus TaxID=76066 RepID=A0AAV6ZZQ4_ENGPU|nr:hypothetical protein GDO81_003024 [Engystomops pustulosus]
MMTNEVLQGCQLQGEGRRISPVVCVSVCRALTCYKYKQIEKNNDVIAPKARGKSKKYANTGIHLDTGSVGIQNTGTAVFTK